jgi:hypothetical protein
LAFLPPGKPLESVKTEFVRQLYVNVAAAALGSILARQAVATAFNRFMAAAMQGIMSKNGPVATPEDLAAQARTYAVAAMAVAEPESVLMPTPEEIEAHVVLATAYADEMMANRDPREKKKDGKWQS